MKIVISVNKRTIRESTDFEIDHDTLRIGGLEYKADKIVTSPIDLCTKDMKTVVAYGLTGSGKTLLTRTVLDNMKYKYPVDAWAIEILNDKPYDLLGNKKVHVGIMGVKGQTVRSLTNRKGIDQFLQEVKENRSTLSTRYNSESSRSHLIIQLGKFRVYDLAGSESCVNRESGHINSSLLTLTRVIQCLATKAPHIPYRDSLLTLSMKGLLEMDSTVLCCCIRLDSDMSETIQSLNHTMTAKKIQVIRDVIKNKVKVNTADLSELEDELDKYKDMYGSLLSWVSQTVTRLPPPPLPPQ